MRNSILVLVMFPMMTVKNKTEVMINCTKNIKVLGQVRAFDRHCNMFLENVKEMWEEVPKIVKGKKKTHPINKDRLISKMPMWRALFKINSFRNDSMPKASVSNVVKIVLGYKYLWMLQK